MALNRRLDLEVMLLLILERVVRPVIGMTALGPLRGTALSMASATLRHQGNRIVVADGLRHPYWWGASKLHEVRAVGYHAPRSAGSCRSASATACA